jgi:hypothetical protein
MLESCRRPGGWSTRCYDRGVSVRRSATLTQVRRPSLAARESSPSQFPPWRVYRPQGIGGVRVVRPGFELGRLFSPNLIYRRLVGPSAGAFGSRAGSLPSLARLYPSIFKRRVLLAFVYTHNAQSRGQKARANLTEDRETRNPRLAQVKNRRNLLRVPRRTTRKLGWPGRGGGAAFLRAWCWASLYYAESAKRVRPCLTPQSRITPDQKSCCLVPTGFVTNSAFRVPSSMT